MREIPAASGPDFLPGLWGIPRKAIQGHAKAAGTTPLRLRERSRAPLPHLLRMSPTDKKRRGASCAGEQAAGETPQAGADLYPSRAQARGQYLAN